MTLDIDIELRRSSFALEAAFTAPAGVTAFFGPSGSGKTSLAQAIAGLLRPARGHIRLDGETLFDAGRTNIPTRRRGIPVVFQDGRLFPHLSVRRNLLFGARDATQLDSLATLLGIAHCLDRRPRTLSGGEQRRVAIGRALLAGPRLLVLDEPMTGLDARRKAEIMPYLERLRDELRIPMILISHAIDEVVRLADSLVLVEAGRVRAFGAVSQVLAGIADADAGVVLDTTVRATDATDSVASLDFADGQLLVPAGDLVAGQRVRLHVRARDVALAIERPPLLSMLNVLPARIMTLTPRSDAAVDVGLAVGTTQLVARITQRSARALALTPDREVYALIKSVAFDQASGSETIV